MATEEKEEEEDCFLFYLLPEALVGSDNPTA